MVRRDAAEIGDKVLVSGTIGDGWLGLAACDSDLGLATADVAVLVDRYRLPQPRVELTDALRAYAHAGADVSDGLIADAGNIARASAARLELDLDRLPLSGPARLWLARQPDPAAARMNLASGGDDYEVICTAPPERVESIVAAGKARGVALTVIGRVCAGHGVGVWSGGAEQSVVRAGWRHG